MYCVWVASILLALWRDHIPGKLWILAGSTLRERLGAMSYFARARLVGTKILKLAPRRRSQGRRSRSRGVPSLRGDLLLLHSPSRRGRIERRRRKREDR